VVEPQAVLAPGSVVPPGALISGGQLWAGVPARYVRDLTKDEVGHRGPTVSVPRSNIISSSAIARRRRTSLWCTKVLSGKGFIKRQPLALHRRARLSEIWHADAFPSARSLSCGIVRKCHFRARSRDADFAMPAPCRKEICDNWQRVCTLWWTSE